MRCDSVMQVLFHLRWMSTRSLVADQRVFTAGLVHRLCDSNPNALNSQRTKERQTLEITLGMATPTDTLVLSYGGWKSHGRATRDLGNPHEKSHRPSCSWIGSTPNSYDNANERAANERAVTWNRVLHYHCDHAQDSSMRRHCRCTKRLMRSETILET